MTSADAPDRTGHIPRVVLVIVTYDSPAGMLEQAVESVLRTLPDTTSMVVDTIVVDNGGTARGRLQRSGLLSEVTVIEPDENLGFGAGVNIGFRHGLDDGADVLMCLNDDIVVQPGWLEPLVDELAVADSSGLRIGGVQPLLVHGGASNDVINSAGVDVDRFGAGTDHLRGKPSSVITENADVAAITGGAAAFSAAYLIDVGLFDERFFLYYEDVELCRRGARHGWRFRVVPSSRVIHHGSASTVRLGDNVRLLQERNRLWSAAMHGSLVEILCGLGLSLRRLRHEPRSIHRRALVDALSGTLGRLGERVTSRLRPGSRPPLAAGDRHVGGGVGVERSVPGVNVVGYNHIRSGLGDVAREFVACLRAAGVSVVEIDNDLSSSPRRRTARAVPTELFDTTVAFVTAFEFPYFRHRFPQLGGPGHRMIGYWFWELDTVPEQHIEALSHADEVWVPTTFVRDAYARAAAGSRPVRLAPIRLPQPDVDSARVDRWRSEFADAFTFLVSFDYLSIPERKNPQAAIDAFLAAFPDPDGAQRLVVKSINRAQREDRAALIEGRAAGDSRIVFLDEHLDEGDHHALLAAADCLVSPHRSEGLGLHPAIAMWLGTPVIATRYGGVVDFCTDDNSLLVDFEVTGVIDGEGIYPEGAPWAAIDVDALAVAMLSIASDAPLRERLAANARRTIEAQGSRAEFGERYRQKLASLARFSDSTIG